MTQHCAGTSTQSTYMSAGALESAVPNWASAENGWLPNSGSATTKFGNMSLPSTASAPAGSSTSPNFLTWNRHFSSRVCRLHRLGFTEPPAEANADLVRGRDAVEFVRAF